MGLGLGLGLGFTLAASPFRALPSSCLPLQLRPNSLPHHHRRHPSQVGGYGTAGIAPYVYPRFLSTVEEYHPARDAWVARPDSQAARYYLSAVGTAQGDVYVVGGFGVPATGAVATFNEVTP